MIQSFAPVVPSGAQLLVLGSIPGVRSLEVQKYYAHPQNQFWRLMARVLNQSAPPTQYDVRLAMLAEGGVALWDVLANCEREGSLDSAIRDERPNDIATLLARTPSIRSIALNGRKAESCYKKYFSTMQLDVVVVSLPSSSAANARMRLEEKIVIWVETLTPLLRT